MDDFNWDESYDEEEFGRRNEIEKGLNKLQRLMFIHDLELHRTQIVPLGPSEFIDLFGEPTEEDLEIMTQILIDDIHRLTHLKVVDKWGLDWIKHILDFNVQVEEYELCAVFKDVMDGVI